jgi:hypothetical protein
VAERPDGDREVLTSLPRSRPVRRSAKRGERGDAKASAKPAARRAPAAKKKAAKPTPAAQRPRPAPKRTVPPAGYAAPASRADDAQASGAADVLTTTIQAAAELAQIGLTVGRQTLRSMLDRLPKP